jgi:hypothetical protein
MPPCSFATWFYFYNNPLSRILTRSGHDACFSINDPGCRIWVIPVCGIFKEIDSLVIKYKFGKEIERGKENASLFFCNLVLFL